jgi:hypothetical protein
MIGPATAGMASTDENLVPFVGLPMYGTSAWLSGPSDGDDPCCITLVPERGPGKLVWELLALGPEAPSFPTEAYHGSGDLDQLGLT